MSVSPERAPNKAREVEIDYVAGNPVAVDGKKMSPAALLAHLNKLGGEHGVGRVDLVENRYVGMKSRGVYETPGGTILHAAHRGLESLTMDREVLHLRDSLIPAMPSSFTTDIGMLRSGKCSRWRSMKPSGMSLAPFE